MSERIVLSSREFLDRKPERKKIDVPVPEFGAGVVVPVWQFTAREKSEWELSTKRDGKGANLFSVRERFVVAVCRNDDGTAYFSAADIAKLAQWPVPIIERLFEAGQSLNAVTEEDVAAMEKNSDQTDAGD